MLVTQRLDARYDWLPSPHNLIHKGAHYRVAYYGNACHFKSDWEEENRDGVSDETHEDQKTKAQGGHIALVSPGGDCSYFTKVMKMRNFDELCLLEHGSFVCPSNLFFKEWVILTLFGRCAKHTLSRYYTLCFRISLVLSSFIH